MAYHTTVYLFLFLPAALIMYQIVPQKMKWKVLLGFSYLFFYLISGKLVIYLIGTTLLTHYIGVWLAWLKTQCRQELLGVEKEEKAELRNRYRKEEKIVLAVGILILLSVLAYLKYYNFFAQNMNLLLEKSNVQPFFQMKVLLLPIGISFYTLQAIGYMADVYWEKIPA